MWMMWSLEMTSSDFKTTSQFGTWKGFRETNAGELPEVTATVGGYGNCWKLRQLLEAAMGSRRGPQ